MPDVLPVPAGTPRAPGPADLRGVPDAVARIENIIRAEKAPPEQAQAPAAPAAPAPALKEQPSAPQEANPEPEAPAGPNKQVEGEEAPAEDAQPVAEIPLDQLEAIELEVTIKGEDGKDVAEKQSIKALREGYMRQADYSRKTAELSRQREQVREETRKAAEAERLKYVTELQTMHDLVTQTAASELGNVDWNDLAQNNAFEYVRLDNRKKQIIQTLSTIKEKQQEALTKHQAEKQAATAEQAAKARTQLESDIPGWNDALYQSLMKAGIEKFGYKQEEVATWIDPRAFKLLHKAHLYDQMQAEKQAPAPDKKVVVAPKVVKPGAARDVNLANLKKANEMRQLHTSGKIEDAAAVIRSRMG
jgi:hypothetical protein